MTATTSDEDAVVVVAVEGDLDAAAAPLLAGRLDDLLAAGGHRYVIDLSHTGVVDGTGLDTLVRFFTRVRIGPGDVRLCGLRPPIRRVFELLRLDRVFDTFDDRGTAVASFDGGA